MLECQILKTSKIIDNTENIFLNLMLFIKIKTKLV